MSSVDTGTNAVLFEGHHMGGGGGGGKGDKTTLIGSAVASYQQLGEWKVIQIS